MSRVTKYYYSAPVIKACVAANPILNKIAIIKSSIGKRYTIAAVYDDDDHTIKFGLSICRPEDNFCKAIGRKISEQNAIERPFHVIKDFSGRRNDYIDEVMNIMTSTEKSLMKKDNPGLFNAKNFLE